VTTSSTAKAKTMRDSSTPLTRKGFFLVERGWRDFDIFKNSPFSEREAWLYLLEQAAYDDCYRHIDGMRIFVVRGQFVASYRYLAEAWEWKKDRVQTFLEKLEKWGWIKVCTDYREESDSLPTALRKPYNRRSSMITINHYNELQRHDPNDVVNASDRFNEENPTASGQEDDKPNQIQPNKNNKIRNQSVGAANQDVFLFEQFPAVKDPEDFINYMPQYWQNYALQEKNWDIETVISEAQTFWERYAGVDMEDRLKKLSILEKKKYWKNVWIKWCDQEFRNTYNR